MFDCWVKWSYVLKIESTLIEHSIELGTLHQPKIYLEQVEHTGEDDADDVEQEEDNADDLMKKKNIFLISSHWLTVCP